MTNDRKKAAEIILKHRGKKPKTKWNIVLEEINKIAPDLTFWDIFGMTKITTKNLIKIIERE